MEKEDNIWKSQFNGNEERVGKYKNSRSIKKSKKKKCRENRKSHKKEKEGPGFYISISNFFTEGSDFKKIILVLIFAALVSKIVNMARDDDKNIKLADMYRRTEAKLKEIDSIINHNYKGEYTNETSDVGRERSVTVYKLTDKEFLTGDIKKTKEKWNHYVNLYSLLRVLLNKTDSVPTNYNMEFSKIGDSKEDKRDLKVDFVKDSSGEYYSLGVSSISGLVNSGENILVTLLNFMFRILDKSLKGVL